MQKTSPTGTRIRQRRLAKAISQAELARRCNISPAYLNLIEHNRRRVSGGLLSTIAKKLTVSVQALREGVEGDLLVGLTTASRAFAQMDVETDKIDEMVVRFPGWAKIILAQNTRIEELEATVKSLDDRLTYDPYLQASMHEVLSSATAIRSAAAILSSPAEMSAAWQGRFQRNVLDDANRLVEASRDLVSYLDRQVPQVPQVPNEGGDRDLVHVEPPSAREQADIVLEVMGSHIAALEGGASVAEVFERGMAVDPAAEEIVVQHLRRYRSDAEALPMPRVLEAIRMFGFDPLILAAYLSVPLDLMLRRLAHCPPGRGGGQVGLLICNGDCQVSYRKPLSGFSIPRFEAACPMWPLRQALAQPGHPMVERVTQLGRRAQPLKCYAIAVPSSVAMSGGPPMMEATMLLIPEAEG